ncbi:T6SS effector BTH_I2691 family protein [Pantoea sp. FN060301]|uniref:T6SS effector BTH_I2691 family protein n=1 Tax=Pantoea sp. FN060301 TaxID=3420380 RepID=UPI003D16E919
MSAECTVCLNSGPVLMPVRYAIVPDAVSQTLPGWAEPATAFPELNGYHYALRCMRQGFIYVYYNTGAKDLLDWEVWSVDKKGDLYRTSNVLGARAVFSPLPCGRPIHQATNLEHMALSENALRYETWVAFSHAPWTQQTIENYTHDDSARAQRMQNIQPAEWSIAGGTFNNGLNRASEEALNSVLDFRPNLNGSPAYPLRDDDDPLFQVSYTENGEYHFFAEKLKPHTTFHPWVRNRRVDGAAARSMKAMESRSTGPGGKPVYPLIYALHDPVGIAHELTNWCDDLSLAHQSYLDELTVEFAAWRSINGVRSQLEAISAVQFDKDMASVDASNDYAGYRAYGMYKKYASDGYQLATDMEDRRSDAGKSPHSGSNYLNSENRARFRDRQIAQAWPEYAKKLDQARLDQFIAAYKALCATIDSHSRALIELRLAWLQDRRFIQCLEDHSTSLTDDNLNYREIVGYAVASINIVPAGRRLIRRWINEYSTADKGNLFWRSQFFNDPLLMRDAGSMLAKMKEGAEKKDQPAKGPDRPDAQTALNSFMGVLGKHGEACDRALDALEKDSKAANVSFMRKMLAAGDRRLTTFTSEVFNKTVLGANLDSANELLYKWLFARDAGVEEKAIRALISSQLDPGPQGATAFRLQMIKSYRQNPHTPLHDVITNQYAQELQKLSAAATNKRRIDATRIKLLATFLNMWELTNQLEEVEEGEGSASGIMSSALFTASFGIQAALPAFETMEKVAESGLPESMQHLSAQGIKLSKWKLRASACGSLAAGLAVINDLGELDKIFEKDGAKRWQAVGLASAKIVSDGAYAIQTSEELLGLLGNKGVISALSQIAGNTSLSIGKTFFASLALRSITILASWQVMMLVAMAPLVIATFTDDELQDWCDHCIFGANPAVRNTEKLSAEQRASLRQEQEEKLVKALHEMLGLPLSEKLLQEEEQKKLEQLKTEMQALQHIHN